MIFMNLITKTHFHACLALILFGIFYIFPGLITLPVLDRDEARFAQASLQMIENKDYINIQFQDQNRHKKPVGSYWFQTISVLLFSPDKLHKIWAYRIPSLFGGFIAILSLYFGLYPSFGRKLAFLSALFMLVSILLSVEARIAKTDALLTGFTTLSLMCIFRIYTNQYAIKSRSVFLNKLCHLFYRFKTNSVHKKEKLDKKHQPKQRNIQHNQYLTGNMIAKLFWISLALSILIKGPVSLMIISVSIFTLVLVSLANHQTILPQTKKLFILFDPVGFILFLAILLPWNIAIGFETNWQFFTQAVTEDLAPKLISRHEGHGAPFGLYFLSFWVLLWPGSLFLYKGSYLVLYPLINLIKKCKHILLQKTNLSKTTKQNKQESSPLAPSYSIPKINQKKMPLSFPFSIFFTSCFIPNWIIFELFPTKLVHYPLPLYPILAIMAALGFNHLRDEANCKTQTLASSRLVFKAIALFIFTCVSLGFILLPVSLLIYNDSIHTFAEFGKQIIHHRVYPILLFFTILMISLLYITAKSFIKTQYVKTLITSLFMALIWQTISFSYLTPKLNRFFVSQQIHALLKNQHNLRNIPSGHIFSPDYSEPSLVFLLGTDIIIGNPELTVKRAFTEKAIIIVNILKEKDKSGLNTFDRIMDKAHRLNKCIQKIGEVKGINYAKGDPVNLFVFKTDNMICPS